MVASIVLTGMHNIGINGNNKIKVNDQLLALSDIPFVRYRFDKYGEEEVEFIKKNKEKFKGPVHMAEVVMGDNTVTELKSLVEIDKLAIFLYVPVTDYDIANGLHEDKVAKLTEIYDADCFFDRLMLKDHTSMIYGLAAERIKGEIEKIFDGNIKKADMGVCGSPLSFRHSDVEGQACLTAVWARKIMAEYADSPDIVVPSASHECMTCCGCIKYMLVEQDLPAPLSSKEKSAAKAKEPKEPKAPKEPKEPKVAPNFGVWDDDL